MIDLGIETSSQIRWSWPVDLDKYDRSPDLTADELAELDMVWQRFQISKSMRRTQDTRLRLDRLLRPIYDVLM